MTGTATFTTASEALPVLCSRLLNYGDEVGSRNGRVREFLNAQIVLTDPQRREILSLNRKANIYAQIAETMWVLSGRNDVEWLSAYLPRAKDYSDDGETWRGGYGPRIRRWVKHPGGISIPETGMARFGAPSHVDQLAHVVDLLKADPLSRRAVISIYDPSVDTEPGKDIPCNDFLQFQNRLGALHMTVTTRSNDLMWGWSGINAFEWSTLQEIVAHLLGVTVGTLTFNIGSLHLYEPHWEKASGIQSPPRSARYSITPFELPETADRTLETVDLLIERWFAWEGMCRKGEAAPSLLLDLDEPLFRDWGAAIAYFWQREDHWLSMLRGTALGAAMACSPASVLPEAPQTSRSPVAGLGHPLHLHERTGAFYKFVSDLHRVKHESYGDSWKKRGEKMSILANIARKVDRLGVGDEFDSSADTMIDLLVYLLKYECWIDERDDGPENVNSRLAHYLAETEECVDQAADIAMVDIVDDFNYYCDSIDELPIRAGRLEFIQELARRVAPIARDLWYAEQDSCDHSNTRIFLKGLPDEHEKCLDCGVLIQELARRVAPIARDLWYAEQQNAQIDKIHGSGAAAVLEAALKDGSVFSDEYRGADTD